MLSRNLFKMISQTSIFDKVDLRTNSWPLVPSPTPVLAIIGCYLIFVLRVGPYIMANQKPLNLRNIMLTYNSIMVLVNVYFFVISIQWLNYGKALLNLNYPPMDDTSAETMWQLNLFYYYWMSKFGDLADTVFFVLRKKHNQITTLHLYHHSVVPLLGWLAIWLRCTAPGVSLFTFLNSAVHVIMYTYYALAALGPELKKYLWWKQYITQIQLTQFFVFVLYTSLVGPQLIGYPKEAVLLAATQPPLFFYMFYEFYQKAYKKKSRPLEDSKRG